jgi:hypothetical protein
LLFAGAVLESIVLNLLTYGKLQVVVSRTLHRQCKG